MHIQYSNKIIQCQVLYSNTILMHDCGTSTSKFTYHDSHTCSRQYSRHDPTRKTGPTATRSRITRGEAKNTRMHTMHKMQGFASSNLNPHVSHLQKSLQLHGSQLMVGQVGQEQSRVGQEQSSVGQEQSRVGQEQSIVGQEQSSLGQEQLLDSAPITHKMQHKMKNARTITTTAITTPTMNNRDPTNGLGSDLPPSLVDDSVRGMKKRYMTN